MRRLCLLILAAWALPNLALAHACDAAAKARVDHRQLTGAVFAEDVRSGEVLASLNGDAAILPLSPTKLLIAAAYWQHRAELPPDLTLDPDLLIAQGQDGDGKRLTVALLHALGEPALRAQLAAFGFPACRGARDADCLSIPRGADDARWAAMLSIGETDIHATPRGLARFLRAVALDGGGVMSPDTAARLRAAMLRTVEVGTASGIRDRLAGLGRIGGKTGTGPAGANPYDGVFAALVFDRTGAPRFAIVTYLRRAGPGGGVPAEVTADLAAKLLSGGCSLVERQ